MCQAALTPAIDCSKRWDSVQSLPGLDPQQEVAACQDEEEARLAAQLRRHQQRGRHPDPGSVNHCTEASLWTVANEN